MTIKELIERLMLQLLILKLQLQVKFLRQKLTIPNLPKPKYVVVHHGGGDYSFEQANKHHKDKWGFISSLGFGLGYQKWIKYGGYVIIARRDNEEGAHTADPQRPHYWNKNSVGICLRGNTNNNPPTEWQLRALKEELDEYKRKGYIVKAHRNIVATSCPGNHLYQWLKDNKYII